MTENPLAKVRHRLATAIDWRVNESVQPLEERVRVLESRIADLESALDRVHGSLGSIATTMSDQQRAHGELLEQVVRRLETKDDKRSTATK